MFAKAELRIAIEPGFGKLAVAVIVVDRPEPVVVENGLHAIPQNAIPSFLAKRSKDVPEIEHPVLQRGNGHQLNVRVNGLGHCPQIERGLDNRRPQSLHVRGVRKVQAGCN